MLVRIIPERIGEHDVDTVLHTLFTHLASKDVFEGLCNPPGGDWSGVSILTTDRERELRWVSLPRVSLIQIDGASGKRPDHVLQIFGIGSTPTILALESKETARSVEDNIGPRLTAYMKDLLEHPADAEREVGHNAQWEQSHSSLNLSRLTVASGVAFIIRSGNDMASVSAKSRADLIMGLSFNEEATICEIHFAPCSPLGINIERLLINISGHDSGIVVSSHSEAEIQGLIDWFDGTV